jgi:hypothetical protein
MRPLASQPNLQISLIKQDIQNMGLIAKRGRLFLGKKGSRLPKSARRARKPLHKDWITGKRPSSVRSANKRIKEKLRPRKRF